MSRGKLATDKREWTRISIGVRNKGVRDYHRRTSLVTIQDMQERSQERFAGLMDHIAVNSEDLQRDLKEYQRMGFRLETLYHDWAMLRDARGFGVALLAPGSKHPPHLGLRVETREALDEAAAREGRQIHEHRDGSISFYTKGVSGNAVEVIYYPPEYDPNKSA